VTHSMPYHALRTQSRALLLCAIALCISSRLLASEFVRSMQVQSFHSPAVERDLKYAVLLPAAYHQSPARFPVLYLLHGHTGNYRSWLNYAELPLDTPDKLGMMIVLVDGGNSFYTNWHGAKGKRAQRWGDMIVLDLIPHVDQHYRSQATRSGRYIGGLSMGGFGAIALALKHPKQFSFAFSSAGALSFAQHAQNELLGGKADWNQPELWSKQDRAPVDIVGFSSQRQRTPKGIVFATIKQAQASDPVYLLDTLKPGDAPYLHLDAGTEDALAPEARLLVEKLRAKGFAHSYLELPGAHEVPYWRDALAHTVLIIQKHRQGALASAPVK
jgi:putative tributyrin esterase